MKILFTGGGSGGHFYPIIAVAQSITQYSKEHKLLPPTLYYMAPSKYNPRALFDNEIIFVGIPAGKIRRYFSILNFFDLFTTAYGIVMAVIRMFSIYPDVVFGKGGYASFPALVAARLLKIPVIIHESDSEPGRVNKWAGKFAQKVAISYPDSAQFFDPKKVAMTGCPIRRDIIMPLHQGAHEFLKLDPSIPTIFIIGGSQGSQKINDLVIDSVATLVKSYQIIHQTGRANFNEVQQTVGVVLKDNPNADRYQPFDYMNDLAIRMASGAASVVVSRAGSTIFEIAAWKLPSIIIPVPESVSHDQTKNAFSYARRGACVVMEEKNLASHVFISEINRIVSNPDIQNVMKEAAGSFTQLGSADKIARVLLDTALEHEK
ncbi:MAG: UDP-N-acetylglucosamine--N-acetylmuramyl-(pentapeptide) pyrophosphoryl-undecaprenol N-acetylglucosamine transferase [Patescibacteria group bacterium]